MSRYSSAQASPFGIRRPSEAKSTKISNIELLFCALAVLALIYLGSLGASTDAWLEAARVELQVSTPTCSTCNPEDAGAQLDERFAHIPAAIVSAVSDRVPDSEFVEVKAVTILHAGDLGRRLRTQRKRTCRSSIRPPLE
jgi:hypothetical protein